jgi:hypothetical protein
MTSVDIQQTGIGRVGVLACAEHPGFAACDPVPAEAAGSSPAWKPTLAKLAPRVTPTGKKNAKMMCGHPVALTLRRID